MSDEPKNLETSEAETAGVSRGRKLASGLGAVVNLALALLITVMINYLAFRHYRVFDLTSARYYELSDQTRNVLQNLQSPLQIIVLFNPESDVYDYIQTLLNEYAAQSPKRVNVLYLDSGLRTKKAEDVAKEFQVGAEENVVIFKYGSRSKFVKHDRMASDLVDYDFSEMQFTGRQRIANYRAEGAFTSAIISVIEEKQPKISFLEGHDER